MPTPVTPHRTVAAGYAHGGDDGAHGHHGQHGAGDRDSQPCGVRQQGEGDGGVTPATPQHRGAARTHPNPSSPPVPRGLRGGETVLDWAPVPWGAPWGPGTSWAEPRAAPGDRVGRWLLPGALQGEAHQAPLGTGSPRRTRGSHRGGSLTSAATQPAPPPAPAAGRRAAARAVGPIGGVPGGCHRVIGTGFAGGAASSLCHSLQVTAEVDLQGQASSCHTA